MPLQQGYVDAGGCRTRWVHAGDKSNPPLVMIHGMGGSWENCFCNIEAHARHFSTYAYDMVGHGFSEKPDKVYSLDVYVEHLKDFLDAMNLDRVSFMGLSLGSWVAAKFAARYPDRVAKVTMISAWGRPNLTPEEIEANRNLMGRSRQRRLASVSNPTWEAMNEVFAHLIIDPSKRLPDLLGLRQKISRQPEMKRAMENILAGLDPETWNDNAVSEEEIASIKAPFLIIAAVEHKDVFLKSAFDYARLLPSSKLVEMKGTSHWPHMERPEEFDRINLEFLMAA
jgi:pimeloyl-ACP methyl ester carboxylesterase